MGSAERRGQYSLWILFVMSLLGLASAAFGAELVEKSYTVSYLGNRNLVWIVAQLHLNMGAFILGAPIFVVICEWLGTRSKDSIFAARYDRLAKEVTKVMAVGYSITALSGGFLALILFGLYPKLMQLLVSLYAPLILVAYPLLFILETILLYTYWYTWDTLKEHKGVHITLGILLNIVGTVLLLGINSVASFMLTPVKDYQTATFWQIFFNFTWWPLNLHRFIANVTFGGFIVGLIAAIMYLTSKKEEDRAFYDWEGFVGNLIGVASFMFLPMAGYLYAFELYQYDASLGVYMMSDRLSMWFETQGMLVGSLFLASNLYIWLSMKRIEGGQRFAPFIKAGFVILLICNAVWLTPRHFYATMLPEPGMNINVDALELPSRLGFLALMPAKKTAAFLSIAVVLMSYILYRAAIKRGKIQWGRIDPAAQYVLIFLGFTAIFTMGLMGSVREMVRKFWHVYLIMRDTTPDAFTPTLAASTTMWAFNTLLFFALVGFIIWMALKMGNEKVPVEKPGLAGVIPEMRPIGGASNANMTLNQVSEETRVRERKKKREDLLKRKLPISIGLAAAVWVVAGLAGFPLVFKSFFVVYVFIGLALILFLEARDVRFPKRPGLAIPAFFVALTAIFIAWGFSLPQFNPQNEIKKIARMNQMALEEEAEKKQQEQLAMMEATKQGWLEELKKNKELLASLMRGRKGEEARLKEEVTAAVVAKAVPPAEATAPATPSAKLVEMGAQVLIDYECTNCHIIHGKGGAKRRGPVLDNIGNFLTPEQMKKKILDPAYIMAEGFEKEYNDGVMPDTFSEQMTKKELEALVAYLSTLKDHSAKTPRPIIKGE